MTFWQVLGYIASHLGVRERGWSVAVLTLYEGYFLNPEAVPGFEYSVGQRFVFESRISPEFAGMNRDWPKRLERTTREL